MTVEAPQLVRCDECGCRFELSARNVRAWHSRGEEPICRECRHPRREPSEAERERMRRWWLDRYPFEELCGLALLIWPTREGEGGWDEGSHGAGG